MEPRRRISRERFEDSAAADDNMAGEIGEKEETIFFFFKGEFRSRLTQ